MKTCKNGDKVLKWELQTWMHKITHVDLQYTFRENNNWEMLPILFAIFVQYFTKPQNGQLLIVCKFLKNFVEIRQKFAGLCSNFKFDVSIFKQNPPTLSLLNVPK